MSIDANNWNVPTRGAAALHGLKRWLLRAKRQLRDGLLAQYRTQRWLRGEALRDAPLLAEVISPLWLDGRPDEWPLVAGKVHNLRRALRAFDAVELPAGATLSFWRQLGPPWALRGFVEGRELQAGCVVPSRGGGLCQLSNGLLQLAMDAGLEVLERHSHTMRIEADAGPALDATVAWNDVDLRLRSTQALRIEAFMNADQLVLRLRGRQITKKPAERRMRLEAESPRAARGCLSCEETRCFRHRPRPILQGRCVALVDAWSPELAHVLKDSERPHHGIEPWQMRASRRDRWPWGAAGERLVGPSLISLVQLRLARGEGGGLQARLRQRAERLADAAAQRLQPFDVELTIAQSLLVPLARGGHLGGRAFDVWLEQLPAVELQRRLDEAARRHPEAPSLSDFRVNTDWAATEMQALRLARRCLTSHADVARWARGQGLPVVLCPWQLASPPAWSKSDTKGAPCLVLPSSALARKGAFEMGEIARHFGAKVRVLGSFGEEGRLALHGLDVETLGYGSAWHKGASAVVLPAWVEHSPRALLLAAAAGIPCFVTQACGVGSHPGVVELPSPSVSGFITALAGRLGQARTMAA